MSRSEKSNVTREPWLRGAITALAIAIIGGIAVEIWKSKHIHENPPVIAISQSVAAAEDVSVAAADIRRTTRRGYLLRFIPAYTDHITTFNVKITNKRGIGFKNCYAQCQWGNGARTVGEGTLLVGTPAQYYGGPGCGFYFDLSNSALTSVDLMWPPKSERGAKPEWLRIRAANSYDFVTSWFNVDLSKVEW